jgi:hypothetical protein
MLSHGRRARIGPGEAWGGWIWARVGLGGAGERAVAVAAASWCVYAPAAGAGDGAPAGGLPVPEGHGGACVTSGAVA